MCRAILKFDALQLVGLHPVNKHPSYQPEIPTLEVHSQSPARMAVGHRLWVKTGAPMNSAN